MDNKFNNYGTSIWDMINEMINYKMTILTQVKSAIVESVNLDGSVNITIPPNNTIYHNVQNQSIYTLSPGDNIKILKENNNLSNIWVIGGFNLKRTKVQDAITQATNEQKLLDHPVLSYYFSDSPTPPNELFGGVWASIEKNNNNFPSAFCWKRIN